MKLWKVKKEGGLCGRGREGMAEGRRKSGPEKTRERRLEGLKGRKKSCRREDREAVEKVVFL